MSIQDLGAIGELIGSLAILITLIYLATQIRLTRTEMESSASQQLIDSFSSVNELIISDERIAVLYSKGLRDPDSLTEAEEIRFRMMVRQAMNGYRGLFLKYKRGLISKDVWESFGFTVYISNPGIERFLQSQEELLGEEFLGYINSVEKVDSKSAYRLLMGGPPRAT